MTKKIDEFLQQMTLKEKASLCSGKNFWNLKSLERFGIPQLTMTDGPHGVRKQAASADQLQMVESVPATCFPTAAGLTASWDRELVFEVGQALGKESRRQEVAVLLGPGANIKRSPLCGRNFEYFSEDPFLTGEIAASHIQGLQSQQVGASLKHFALNNQEDHRLTIDVVVDERTLREIYLTGFEIAVKKAQPWTVMCAYNKLDDIFCSENSRLLTDILRNEWGYMGLVVSDWGATNDRVAGLKSGLELEMPGSGSYRDEMIIAAVKNGQLSEDCLDQATKKLLGMMLKGAEALKAPVKFDIEEHHALARKAAAESMVLLKNENGLLPLSVKARIAVVGRFARTPRYQGSGSSLIKPIKLENAYDEILKLVPDPGLISFAPGYAEDTEDVNDDLLQQACEAAKAADVVVVFAGLPDSFECEGFDRAHLQMPKNHNALIEAVSAVNAKVVVALSNGSAIEMPWLKKVQAVLEGYLGGQAAGGALGDCLFGLVNPSGKLAETFPFQLEDNPSYRYFPGGPKTVEYRESIYLGYRYYDKAQKAVLFPFGHGLSYTSFEYSDLNLSTTEMSDVQVLTVRAQIKNVGKVKGREIVQLYVQDVESSIFRPDKELKGFEKIELEAGERETVTFTLDKRAFAYYNVTLKDWQVETGTFEILLGASSRDIRLSKEVVVHSTVDFDESQNANIREALPAYYEPSGSGFAASDAEFTLLYGAQLPTRQIDKHSNITANSTMEDISHTWTGRLLAKIILKQVTTFAGDNQTMAIMMERMVAQLVLRMLPVMSAGRLSFDFLEGLLLWLNKRHLKGLAKMLRSLGK